ncbi:MAG: hypothetical protein A2288_03645 [Candidatus Moranbacteria bacterium RIFOXYA12_FULL_44_15]|nr:MAG: hypothetical protein A2288_03645 [Candidatus Moranbacteria bacterium RIFOXYA12_FULL_44_15]
MKMIKKMFELRLTKREARKIKKVMASIMLPILIFQMTSLNFVAMEMMTASAEGEVGVTEEAPEEEVKEDPKEEEALAPKETIVPEVTSEEESVEPKEKAVVETPVLETAPAEDVFEEVKSEEETKTEAPVEEKAEWVIDGNTASIEPVELNKTYKAPQNSKVTVTFTKLPEKAGSLVIKEIKLSAEEMLSLGALSDTAYDITSNMENGTFEYDLTLPYPDKKNNEKVKADDVQVLYTEENEIKKEDLKNVTEDESVDEIANDSKKVMEIKGLDHFTIFILTVPTPDSERPVLINEIYVNSVDGADEWVELYNNTNGNIDVSGWEIVDNSSTADIRIPDSTEIPARGLAVFYHSDGWLNDSSNEIVTLKNGLLDIDSVEIGGTSGAVIDHYPAQGESAGRTIDGGSDWRIMTEPTEGYTNDNSIVYVDDGADVNEEFGTEDYPFNTIQEGIDSVAAGGTVNVAEGTYDAGFSIRNKSNLNIVGKGASSTTVNPSLLITSGIGHKYTANSLVTVLVDNSTEIHISGMTINSNSSTPGSGGADSIVLWNASTGSIDESAIAGIYTINGSQTGQGLGVDAGSGKITTLTVSKTAISGFQKNAIDAVNGNSNGTGGAGTIDLTVDDCTITGNGPTMTIAQNGILAWNQGGGTVTGTINKTDISGFNYTPDGNEAAGVLTYGSATISTISNSNFDDNEISISAYGGGSIDATSGNEFDGVSPSSANFSELAIIENTLLDKQNDPAFGLVYLLEDTLIVTPEKELQNAIDAASPGDTINVTEGIYDEQVTINESLTLQGAGDTTIIKPTQATANVFQLFNRASGGSANTAGIIASNVSGGNVIVKNIKVDGSLVSSVPSGTNRFVGILLRDLGSALVDSVKVDGINISEGNAILMSGYGTAMNGEVKNSHISDYNKNGITANNSGLVANIHNNVILGAGSTASIAQNGIQIGFGAVGSIKDNNVSGNVWSGTYSGSNDPIDDVEADGATGVLLYMPGASPIEISNNTLINNQFGIWTVATPSINIHDNSINGLSHTGKAFPVGISVWSADQWAGYFSGSEVATVGSISKNIINNNDYGVIIRDYAVGGAAPNVILSSENKIDSNAIYGTWSNVTLNAEENWWGTADSTEIMDKVYTGVDYDPWYVNSEMTILSDTVSDDNTITPTEGSDLSLGSGGEADLPSGITNLVLNDDSNLDLSGGLEGGAVTLQSGVDGNPIILTNSDLPGVSASIPDGTTITGPAGWDGVITPPTHEAPSGDAPAGFSVGGTVISVGSPGGTLIFSNPITLVLAGVAGTVGYKPAGSTAWVQITNICGGSYDTPTFVSNECSISDGTDTKILTNHFTDFGELEDIAPPSVPILTLPSNNEYLTTHNFTFRWNASTDDSPVTYEWEFSYLPDTNGGGGSFVSRSGYHANLSTSVDSPGTPDNVYYWHVRAIDEVGNASAWSDPWKVTVDTSAPNAPTHVSPFDGINTTTANQTKINWSDVSDSSAPIFYFYQSSTSPTLNPDGAFASPAYTSGALPASEISTAGTPTGTYYWHVRAADAAGNSSAWSNAWRIVVDNTAPTGLGTPTPNVSSPTNSTVINWVWTAATDIGSGVKQYLWELWNSTAMFLSGTTSVAGVSTSGLTDETYTMKVAAEDNAGNESGEVSSATLTVDSIPPVITINPYSTALTNDDITVTASTNEGSLNTTSHTFTANDSFDFVATDDAGNTTIQTVTINNIDKSAPVVAITAPTASVSVSGTVAIRGTVTDSFPHHYWLAIYRKSNGQQIYTTTVNHADEFTNRLLYSWNTIGRSDGVYQIKFAERDAADNRSTDFVVEVTVDNTAPVISLDGITSDIEVGGSYVELGATATDAIDGSFAATSSGSVNTSIVGTYIITYNATDAAGNHATPVIRTVRVVDTTAPVVMITIGTDTVEVHTSFTDAGATWTDAVDGSGTVASATSGTVNTDVVGDYTLTYAYTDANSNTGSATRTVHVVDTTRPVITLLGVTPATVELGSTYTDAGATALDNYDGNLTTNIVAVNPVDANIVGVYTVTYNVTDIHHNVADQVTRTVDVVDTTAPDVPIQVSPTDGVYLTSTDFTKADWGGVDDLSIPISYFYQSSNSSDTNPDGSFVIPIYTSAALSASEISTSGTLEGIYYWHVRAVDTAGNSSAWSSVWRVTVDNTAPILANKTTFSNWYNTIPQTSTFHYTDDFMADGYVDPTCDITTEGGNQTCSVIPNPSICDKAGNCNTETAVSNGVNIDLNVPDSEITFPNDGPDGVVYLSDWNGTLEGTAGDNLSGVQKVELLIKRDVDDVITYWNGADWQADEKLVLAAGTTSWTYGPLALPLVDGEYSIESHATDNAGNIENTFKLKIVFDKTIPTVGLSIDPVSPDGDDDWYVTNPIITLAASDKNLDRIEYQIDSKTGTWSVYVSPVKIEDGEHIFYYRSIDKAGNTSEIGAKNVKTDTRDPDNVKDLDAEYEEKNNEVELSWDAEDSDIDKVYVYRGDNRNFKVGSDSRIARNDRDDESYTDDNVSRGEKYYYKFVTQDESGNKSNVKIISVKISEDGGETIVTDEGTESLPAGTVLGEQTPPEQTQGGQESQTEQGTESNGNEQTVEGAETEAPEEKPVQSSNRAWPYGAAAGVLALSLGAWWRRNNLRKKRLIK